MTWQEELARYESLGCLHEMFERQVALTPNSTAVVDDEERKMTFAELNEACDTLADNLILKGVVRESPVGIYMERCVDYVIAFIAIFKSGGAYIPLDVSYPDVLLEDIFADAKPACVITSYSMIERLQDKNQQVIVMDRNWMTTLKSENVASKSIIKRPAMDQSNLACIVYSSGTTGKPKGIMLLHRCCVFSYTWRHVLTPFKADDRVACNVFFVWELIRPLLKGIPLYIVPDTVIYDPLLLAKFIKKHSITRILFTPSLLETVLDARNINMSDFSSLRLIWFCGEVVTTSLFERCVSNMPWVKFYNLYSISECHDVAIADLSQFLQQQTRDDSVKRPKYAPVGRVCPGIEVYILDGEGNVQPVGMPGEIFVGGPTLARGYLNRPEMNAKRFIKRKSATNSSEEITLYRTGDWGLMKLDRNLEICGRCDSMVKVRGYSIEIQAVEAAIMSLPTVKACVVLALGDEGQDKQLVAYIVAEDKVTKREIKADLRKKLPFYMVPSYFMFLKSIPVVAATGKLDKKALPSIHSAKDLNGDFSMLADDEKTLPTTETEKFLEKAWCSLLQMEFVDIQESFFDLGGHSLLAARLLGIIREKYGDSITMQVLFAYPTICELGKWLDSENDSLNQKFVSKIDLDAEVRMHKAGPVNLDIQLRAFWRSRGFGYKSRRARVLLTGATGFLGAFLLRDLLLETKVQVYCLVRPLPNKSAEAKLRQNLDFYKIFEQENSDDKDLMKAYQKRVHSVTGDVALFELGLNEEDYTYLSYEVDYVIHAAAYVNLVYPYEALKGANVTGTQNVLIFARSGKVKPVHYVSTNAVFANGKEMCQEISSASEDTSLLENGYAQSKWVAEQLVRNAISQGLPATIYRIGNISGSTSFASWNPSDFILLVLRASLITSSWPDVDWTIEMTPVNFVSKCIVRLSQELQTSVHKIFHLVQPKAITGKWLYKWLKSEFGYKLDLIPLVEWCSRIQNLTENTSNGHPSVKKILQSMDSPPDENLFSYKSTFDQINLNSALKTIHLTYPDLDGKLLRHYIVQLAKQKIIAFPVERRGSALRGRVAVVTGASSGIGRSIALFLTKEGAKVCIAARSLDKLEKLKQEINKDGGDVTVFQCDVTVRGQVMNLVQHAENLWGAVDILVNSAGVMYYTHMSNVMMDDWDSMIDINCKGVTNSVGAAIPGMIKRNRGHIVNISSDAGLRGFPGLAVYSGTKFFVEGFSQALRHEMVDKGIKVTCIQPGDVKTNLLSVTKDEDARKQYDGSTSCKILDPEDVARAVVYILSQPDYVAINQLLIEPKEAPI
ncbi:uncharacterized protein LOC143468326 isoform X2 [Clavelina lepadiformis]|uniref:uncharacterized protein LOC143468326 isoform X2 n=1 Tax=Clavelina lepadiformis TaxID=159417 RepID=UPI004042D790